MQKQTFITNNNNTIITFTIKKYEVVTINYGEESILALYYNEDSIIQAQVELINCRGVWENNIVYNCTNNINALIEETIEELNAYAEGR